MSNLDQLPLAEQRKIAAWTACNARSGFETHEWRVDAHGNPIRRADYGKQTEYGWEIDHVVALCAGGLDILSNLRALHWRSNRSLGGLMGAAPNALRGLMALGEQQNHLRNLFNDPPLPNPFSDPSIPKMTGRGVFGTGR